MNSVTIRLSNHGIVPNSDQDITPLWNRFLAQFNANPPRTPTTLLFEPGRYHFYADQASQRECYISNHTQTGNKKCALLFENQSHLTLDGAGAEFIFHGTLIPVALIHSVQCTLKNFSIDYQYPPIHQLRIISVDPFRRAITVETSPDESYRIINGREILFLAEDNASYPLKSVIHFESDGRMVYQQPDRPFDPESIIELEKNLLEISGWRDDLTPGQFLVLRASPRPTPGIFLHKADNARIENVSVHFSFGMSLLAQLTENVTLDRFRVCRRGDQDPRRFTAHADATHFSGCKGVIQSENGLYEGMNDDAINVHGTYLKVLEKLDERTYLAGYMHHDCWGFEWGCPGDTVRFIRPQTMEYVDPECRIAAITPADAPTSTGAKVFKIVLDRALPAAAVGCGVENMSWTPEVIFRGNTIRNNRARGALFSTPRRVICEDNIFDHVHGSAILLCGDCNGWYETGACHNVLIRRNKFINNLTAYYQFTKAVISIYPEIPDLRSQKKLFHSHIAITDNEFDMFDRPLLYAKSAEHVEFSGNRIRYNQEFQPFHENCRTFLFEHATDVTIAENDFGPYPELERDAEFRSCP